MGSGTNRSTEVREDDGIGFGNFGGQNPGMAPPTGKGEAAGHKESTS